MDDRSLATLEFFKILDQLVDQTAFSASRELAQNLRPSGDEGMVRRRLQETTEAKDLLSRRPGVTVGGAHDVRGLAHRAAISAVLQPPELLDVRATLISARSIYYLLVRRVDEYPILAGRAAEIAPLSQLIDEIGRCLDEDGRVLDDASPELARIRRESARARDRLLERLNRIVSSGDGARFLQEPIVTERHGRYVVPLKIEFKGRIAGIIHDQSSSGATLFIEPLATVDLNNRWHELQLAEVREVERILAALSDYVGGEAEAIIHNVAVLAELDLAFAKARYSFELRASPAEISTERWPIAEQGTRLEPSDHPLNLIKARHPMLPRDSVVPIDAYMGGDYTVVLISGPNTGGKTVSLKTVGLLASMSQAGLHIPAVAGSKLPVFTGIYADIGDEQSIEQSLSTFSSHMTHIVDILARADENALVLLDELGAGTDPIEGSALAQALIGAFLERHSLVLCSSHYSQLKVFAYDTPGVENASVEFDTETLSPTYRLIIGLPGQSNAFAIASRLGLEEPLIERARGLLSAEDSRADNMLSRLKEASDRAVAARQEAEGARDRVRDLERDLRRKLGAIEEARRQVLDEARAEGRDELDRVRDEVRRLRRGLRSGRGTGLTQVDDQADALESASATLEALESELAPLDAGVEWTPPPSEDLRAGDLVHVRTLNQTGEVLSLGAEDAEVAVGGFRLRTSQGSLEFRSRPDAREVKPGLPVRRPQIASPGMELHLRGMRAEEIAPVLGQYLDSAYLAGLPWVRIVHGKGMGVLMSVVRDYLVGHPLVRSHRRGEFGEGGDGVTVVELKRAG